MAAAEVTRAWVEAINRHDPAGFAALYAPNAIVRDPQYAEPLEGRDAIQRDMETFFTAFPDLQAEVRGVLEAGDSYASEGRFTGTHEGPLATPTGDVPASGKRMAFAGAGFYRLDAKGRILEENRYYDLTGFLAQLGITP